MLQGEQLAVGQKSAPQPRNSTSASPDTGIQGGFVDLEQPVEPGSLFGTVDDERRGLEQAVAL